MVALERKAVGMVLVCIAGLANTADLACSKEMRSLGLPYFRSLAAATVIIDLSILVCFVVRRPLVPTGRLLKWVALRGLAGVLMALCAILAVRCGTSLGNTGALNSVNTVFAAMLGRLFLGEPLRRPHALGLACAFAGAVLISKPGFLFGHEDAGAGGLTLLGGSFALASGFFSSCVFIGSRKAQGVSPLWFALSTMLQRGAICLALGTVPAMADGSMSKVASSPWAALGWVVALACVHFTINVCNSAGAQRCPAAISATMFTACAMVSGYGLQALLYKEMPDAVTLSGAALMLLSVVVMASARLPQQSLPRAACSQSQAAESVFEGVAVTDEINSHTADATVDDAASLGEESLLSFIVHEFSVESPHSQRPSETTVRQRRHGAGAEPTSKQTPAARVLGAVVSLA